ncbi:hypothetical protein [Alishewanella longhuensis]
MLRYQQRFSAQRERSPFALGSTENADEPQLSPAKARRVKVEALPEPVDDDYPLPEIDNDAEPRFSFETAAMDEPFATASREY